MNFNATKTQYFLLLHRESDEPFLSFDGVHIKEFATVNNLCMRVQNDVHLKQHIIEVSKTAAHFHSTELSALGATWQTWFCLPFQTFLLSSPTYTIAAPSFLSAYVESFLTTRLRLGDIYWVVGWRKKKINYFLIWLYGCISFSSTIVSSKHKKAGPLKCPKSK